MIFVFVQAKGLLQLVMGQNLQAFDDLFNHPIIHKTLAWREQSRKRFKSPHIRKQRKKLWALTQTLPFFVDNTDPGLIQLVKVVATHGGEHFFESDRMEVAGGWHFIIASSIAAFFAASQESRGPWRRFRKIVRKPTLGKMPNFIAILQQKQETLLFTLKNASRWRESGKFDFRTLEFFWFVSFGIPKLRSPNSCVNSKRK